MNITMKLKPFRSIIVASLIGCTLITLLAAYGGLIRPAQGAGESAASEVVKYTPSDPVLLTIIAGLKNRESKVTTVQGYLTEETYNNSDPAVIKAFSANTAMQDAQKRPPSATQIFFVADGRKEREDEKTILPSAHARYDLAAYDGEKIQAWGYGDSTASEFNGDEDIPVGYHSRKLQLCIGKISPHISEELESHPLRLLGKELIGGIETYKIEASPAPGRTGTTTYWIAPSRGYLILKQELQSVAQKDEDIVSHRNVYLVEKIRQINGVWIPVITRGIGYITLKGQDHETWAGMNRLSTISFKVNVPVSSSLFELPLPLGTTVIPDRATRREIYVVGGDVTSVQERIKRGIPDDKELLDTPMKELE